MRSIVWNTCVCMYIWPKISYWYGMVWCSVVWCDAVCYGVVWYYGIASAHYTVHAVKVTVHNTAVYVCISRPHLTTTVIIRLKLGLAVHLCEYLNIVFGIL